MTAKITSAVPVHKIIEINEKLAALLNDSKLSELLQQYSLYELKIALLNAASKKNTEALLKQLEKNMQYVAEEIEALKAYAEYCRIELHEVDSEEFEQYYFGKYDSDTEAYEAYFSNMENEFAEYLPWNSIDANKILDIYMPKADEHWQNATEDQAKEVLQDYFDLHGSDNQWIHAVDWEEYQRMNFHSELENIDEYYFLRWGY